MRSHLISRPYLILPSFQKIKKIRLKNPLNYIYIPKHLILSLTGLLKLKVSELSK